MAARIVYRPAASAAPPRKDTPALPRKPANDCGCGGSCGQTSCSNKPPQSIFYTLPAPAPTPAPAPAAPAESDSMAQVFVGSTLQGLGQALQDPNTQVVFIDAGGVQLPMSMRDLYQSGTKGLWAADFGDGGKVVFNAAKVSGGVVHLVYVAPDGSQLRYRGTLLIPAPQANAPAPAPRPVPPPVAAPANAPAPAQQPTPPVEILFPAPAVAPMMVDGFMVEALANPPAGLPADRLVISPGTSIEIGGRHSFRVLGASDLGIPAQAEGVFVSLLHTPEGDVPIRQWCVLRPGSSPPEYFYGRTSKILAPPS